MIFLAVVALLSGCDGTLSTWQVGDPGQNRSTTRASLDAEVDEVAGSLVRDGQTPGIAVGLLLPDGSTRYFGYGLTQETNGTTPGPDTLFAVGSLSKGFLGAIAATLVQEKKLSWQDTLSSLLPQQTPLSPDAAKISVEQLATHTSGLPRQPIAKLELLTDFISYLFTGDNFYRQFDRDDEVLPYLATYEAPAVREPRYSNIGYAILGLALERRTGLSVDSLLATRITIPLGLTHTGYSPENLPGFAERARGHAGDQPKFVPRGHEVPDWKFTGIMRGSAGLYSSVRDLLTNAAASMRRDGTPLSTALADTLRIRYPRNREAAAVNWIEDNVNDQQIEYQVGFIAGYSSYIGLNPHNHTAVIVLQNSFNWDFSAGQKLVLWLADYQTASE